MRRAVDPGLHYGRTRPPSRSIRRDFRTEAIVSLSDAAMNQVTTPVDDFERGVAFYRDVPGIPLLFTGPLMPKVAVATA
jgi:hypothetical protein